LRKRGKMDGMKFFMYLFGGIWAAVGGVFLVVACVLAAGMGQEPYRSAFLPLLFFALGGTFAAAGLAVILVQRSLAKRKRRLLESGRRIYAEVAEIYQDTSVSINGSCPWRVSCRYVDEKGTVHIFRSDRLGFDPSGLLTSKLVPVYIEEGRTDRYAVDLAAVLPRVEVH